MERNYFIDFDPKQVPSPCFVVDRQALRANLKILKHVMDQSGCKILLAQKGFSMWSLYPEVAKTLPGVCASGLHEALLGREEFKTEVHTYSPAYKEDEIQKIAEISDHIVFNTPNQYQRFREKVKQFNPEVSMGLRVNPEHSTGEVPIYDPCGPFSRLGSIAKEIEVGDFEGLDGIHFHTLCEQDSSALEETLQAVEKRFGHIIPQLKWVNFGGGHHITRADYNVDLLIELIKNFQDKYQVQVYLEPGEAVALNTGILVATVLDVMKNGMEIAILDTSATAHMPDVLEMPYRPFIWNSGEALDKPHTYRLGGSSCLAGDVIGDYSFDQPLKVESRLVFSDMAHYSMVKTTTFNGVKLPSIGIYDSKTKEFTLVKDFGYQDFKMRLS